MIKKSTVSLYLKHGLNLTLVKRGGNAPILKDWQNKNLKEDKLHAHIKRGGNLGFSIGENHIVIDVDPENGGNPSYKKLQKIIGKYKPNTLSPSGGQHIYFKLPKSHRGQKFRGKLGQGKEFKGIDVLGSGKQVVIPTSERPNRGSGHYEWGAGKPKIIVHKIPKQLLLMIQKGGSTEGPKERVYSNELISTVMGQANNRSNMSKDQAWKIVNAVPNNKDTEYDTWLEVGMSLHDWNPDKGVKLWRRWSKKNKKKHNERELTKKWNSFSLGGGITMGSLVFKAKDAVYDERQHQIDDMKVRIYGSNKKTLETTLIKEMRQMGLDRKERKVLGQCIAIQFKKFDGVALTAADIEAMITPAFKPDLDIVQPDWAADWLYVTSHSAFLNTDTRQVVKREGFDLMLGRYIPPNPKTGAKPSAFKHCADKGYTISVSRLAYVPFNQASHFVMEGTTYGNLFNPQSVPEEAERMTKAGKAAVRLIKDHFMLITGDQREADILIDWVAHNVQYMGEKIMWSPLVQSIEGTGKTFVGQLLTSCIGNQNVGIASPSMICSDFNDYAMGSAVCVFQELRIKGQNRYQVVNAVKPLITDNYIAYHPKGAAGYTVMNTTNYYATSNFKDAVPLDKDDRRWFVIFMQIQSLDEMKALTGKTANEYFGDLFDALRDHGPEIKKWLMSRDLTEFKKIKTAPMTRHKQTMIATENTGHKGVKAVERLLAEGGSMFNVDVVNLQALYDALLMSGAYVDLTETDKVAILKRLGYSLHPNTIEFKGALREFWTKRPMVTKEIKKALKKEKIKRIEA